MRRQAGVQRDSDVLTGKPRGPGEPLGPVSPLGPCEEVGALFQPQGSEASGVLTSVACTGQGLHGSLILTGSPAWPVGPGGPSAPCGKASSFREVADTTLGRAPSPAGSQLHTRDSM